MTPQINKANIFFLCYIFSSNILIFVFTKYICYNLRFFYTATFIQQFLFIEPSIP